MFEDAKIICFRCGKEGNHWHSWITVKDRKGFFTCVRPEV